MSRMLGRGKDEVVFVNLHISACVCVLLWSSAHGLLGSGIFIKGEVR